MPKFNCATCVRWAVRALIAALAGAAACGPTGIFGNNTTLGGDTPGSRGSIRVMFINRTPFRAIFTYGTYDTQNTDFGPDIDQFSVNPDPSLRLEGNSTSGVVSLTCGRVFSIGGEELIARIKDKGLTTTLSEEALQPGIVFSDKPLDDAEAGQPTAGQAPPVVTLQGSEFPCDALLIYTFSLDDTQDSGFRVDTEVVPP